MGKVASRLRGALFASAFLIGGVASAATLTPIAGYAGPSPYAGAGSTSMLGINNAGYTTGSVTYLLNAETGDSAGLGFVRAPDGTYTTFTVPNAIYVQGRAISSTGAVTGYYVSADGVQGNFIRTADGTVKILANPVNGRPLTGGIAQGINDAGVIVGDYRNGSTRAGYVLDTANNSFQSLDVNASLSRIAARGINNDGLVVGFASVRGGTGSSGYINDHGNVTILNHAGGYETVIEAVNNVGQVSGMFYTDQDTGASHGFIYDLTTHVFTDIDAPNSKFTQIFGLNDKGQAVLTSDAGQFIYSSDGPTAPDGSAVYTGVQGLDLPDGTTEYSLDVQKDQTYFIDPAATTGYLYTSGDGPLFAGVTVTSDAELWLFSDSANDWQFIASLLTGQAYDFTTALSRFELRGLSGTGSDYVTGLRFAGDGHFNGRQIALTDAQAAVPEPATWAMMLGGFGLLGSMMRRRARVTAAA